VLLHGAAAILSHETAARLHGLPIAGPTNTVHVTLVGKARRGCPGAILIHRVTAIHPQEHHRLRGLPVTSLARTVIDLSPGLAPRARERLVDEAIKRTSETKLREALARHPGRPGTPAIRALLGGDRPSTLTWSVAEERLLTLIRTAGLPTPEVNIPLEHGYVPDLLWRAERVIVEFDSYTHHSGPAAFRDDRTRHNALTALGYQLLHVTWDQLTRYPERVLVWIARALAAG
jgi:very-short-patch-repair endonuclease